MKVEHVMPTSDAGFPIDLVAVATAATRAGPAWSYESTDLDMTLLSWTPPQEITTHINDEVDVVLIGVIGTGEVTVDGEVYHLAPGQLLLIPKHAERSLRCLGERWSYLSLHQRRRGLWPTVGGAPPR